MILLIIVHFNNYNFLAIEEPPVCNVASPVKYFFTFSYFAIYSKRLFKVTFLLFTLL